MKKETVATSTSTTSDVGGFHHILWHRYRALRGMEVVWLNGRLKLDRLLRTKSAAVPFIQDIEIPGGTGNC